MTRHGTHTSARATQRETPRTQRRWRWMLCWLCTIALLGAACSDDSGPPSVSSNNTTAFPDTGTNNGDGGSDDDDTDGEDSGGEDVPDAGDEPDADAGDEPDADAGDEPDADVGDEPDADAGDEPDADAGDEPDADAGDEPDADAGDEPDAPDDASDAGPDDASDASQDTDTPNDASDAGGGQDAEPDVPEEVGPLPDTLEDTGGGDDDGGGSDDTGASPDVDPDADPDGGNQGPQFTDSCLFDVVECYSGLQVTSCTVNDETGLTDVSLGAEASMRIQRDADNRASLRFFTNDTLCFEALALDTLNAPQGWDVTDGTPDAISTQLLYEGDTTRVICPGGEEETWATEDVTPYFPELLDSDDPICQRVETPRCVTDQGCQDANPDFICCEVADTTRCLFPSQCPDLPPDEPEFDSCIADTLGCFGTNFTKLACIVDPGDGFYEADYIGDRRASWLDDGFPTQLLDTADLSTGTFCYSAEVPGGDILDAIDFFDPNTGDAYRVEFLGDQATVFCPDASQEQHPASDVLQFVPARPTVEDDDVCEVVPFNDCVDDSTCNGGSCCDTEEGRRCLPFDQCPPPDTRWQDSCLFAAFDCFGTDNELAVCTDYGDVDYTSVNYTNGAAAVFSSQSGRSSIQAQATPNFTCYDALRDLAAPRYEILSGLNGGNYVLDIQGDEAIITCPDDSIDIVAAEDVTPYLPTRPAADLCEPPVSNDECTVDADCENPLLVCCDGGDRNICIDDCERAQPRNLCDGDIDCADGLTCCNQPSIRVCDAALCGDQVCCFVSDVPVCETQEACEEAQACDPDDPDACPGGLTCCEGVGSATNLCRPEPECADFEAPLCDGDADCTDLGDGWLCCPSEGPDRCQDTRDNGGQCIDLNPACAVDADCPGADEVCCLDSGTPTCVDALLCGDSCNGDADCPGDLICCRDTNQCSTADNCSSSGLCETNDDCGEGAICCHAGPDPLCIAEDDCPSPCSSDDDCSGGRICCGSQGSRFGAFCSEASACDDVEPRACTVNGDCQGGQLCCRTLDEPACVDAGSCPVACDPANPCADGETCCGSGVRTPVCVPDGTCELDLGESCSDTSECSDGLTCCGYDSFGDVCVPSEFCDTAISPASCEASPIACDAFPLAVCCSVNGTPQCANERDCDLPAYLVCTDDDDCGSAGFRCCTEDADSDCLQGIRGRTCGNENQCATTDDCPQGLVCCPEVGNICIQPERCE